MKAFIVLAVLALVVIVAADEKYTTKYDNVNLNDIINNKRLLKNYVNCLLNKGKCTPDGQELKKVLPDALKTDCAKCSEKQKEGAEIILNHMLKHEEDSYAELEKLYDPEQIYKKKFLALQKEKNEKDTKDTKETKA